MKKLSKVLLVFSISALVLLGGCSNSEQKTDNTVQTQEIESLKAENQALKDENVKLKEDLEKSKIKVKRVQNAYKEQIKTMLEKK